MSGDIVERLRQSADTSSGGGGDWYQLVYRCREAADEIERLRAAGDALVKCVNQFGDTDNWTHDDGFLFHDEALAAIAAWQKARRER